MSQDPGRFPKASAVGRRLFDITVSLIGLSLGAAPLVVAAAATKLSSPGPIFHRSERAGLHGRPFSLLKLRTMYARDRSELITRPDDDRVTKVGRVLRRLKIDEIPQLWNVLVGDMSLVGPRPEDYTIVIDHYTAEERQLLSVRPGITSRVQVEWYPDVIYHLPPPPGVSVTDYYIQKILHPKLTLELRSLDRQSLPEDIRVVARTVYSMIRWSVTRPPRRDLPEEFR